MEWIGPRAVAPAVAALRIAHFMATCFFNVRLNTQKDWRIAPENDDFLLKNGHLLCNSQRPGGGAEAMGDRAPAGQEVRFFP